MKQFWNERYSQEDYAYGTEPNEFLKEQLNGLTSGKILFPAEGEGRNAVYAAQLNWEVTAFDQSEEGKKKADSLAASKGVSIDYRVGMLEDMDFQEGTFDAIVLVYVHLPAGFREKIHRQLISLLKPGGRIILEAFHKDHLKYNSVNEKAGGPRQTDLLFSIEDLVDDFASLQTELVEEKVVVLNEGLYHVGESAVVRFVGVKA